MGFGVRGLGFRVWGLGFGFRVWGLGFGGLGVWAKVYEMRFGEVVDALLGVSGLRLRIRGFGFRVWELKFSMPIASSGAEGLAPILSFSLGLAHGV